MKKRLPESYPMIGMTEPEGELFGKGIYRIYTSARNYTRISSRVKLYVG